MILRRLTLHDFGVYRGRQVVDLAPPSRQKPVILIGGLNGGGKTTLLEAIRLALHGRAAAPWRSGSVEIELSHVARGKPESLVVCRRWAEREEIEVYVDGALDPLGAEEWPARVQELIPERLASFFFFDGERIEALADVDRGAEALRTAVHALLGIDLVEQLVTDLQMIERRARALPKSEIAAAEAEVMRLLARREELENERGAARGAALRAEKALTEAEEAFERGGGSAFARQREVEAQLAEAIRDLAHAEESLREESEGMAPLLLVGDWIEEIAAEGERALAGRVLAAARAAGAGEEVLRALAMLFDADPLASSARAMPVALEETRSRIARRLAEADALVERLAALERVKEAAPEEERVMVLVAKRDEARADLDRAREVLAAVEAGIARVTRELDRCEQAASARREDEAITRVAVYAERVRGTMRRFREALLARRVRRIEALVLESLRGLLHKETLITEVSIDPRTFALRLHGAGGRAISAAQLSAGERQILAMATLGALARASGRALPVVIDAPLGRLDSAHRERLVERYFPYASHQVILLCTDEELDRAHLDRLAPFVGRAYTLQHDDATGATRVAPGYFS